MYTNKPFHHRRLSAWAGAACLAMLTAGNLSARELVLPAGMGGAPDIGAIPCNVFSEMLVVGPLGTRLSMLTWAEGYLYAKTELSMEELVSSANEAGENWSFDTLTDHFVSYCKANPEAITRSAAEDLANQFENQSN